MLAWKMFKKSVLLVIDNLPAALRVSGTLYLIYAVIAGYLFVQYPELLTGGGDTPEAALQLLGPGLFLIVIQAVIFVWIAIGWHRYVLLSERPTGPVPRLENGTFWTYLGRSIVLGILVGIAAVLVGALVGALLGTLGLMLFAPEIAFLLVGLASGLAAVVLFYRLSPILPAAAVDTPMTLSEAWGATQGHTGTVAALAVIALVLYTIIMLPQQPGTPVGIALLYNLVITWITTMIGVSLLTTLYGHFIEGRSLD